jgi:uncharacterized protein YkwD
VGSYGEEPDATPSALEGAVLEAALSHLHLHTPRPRPSASLALAARALARRAADGDPDPLARPHLRAALAGALAFDPAPVAHLVAGDRQHLPELLARISPLPGATHAGAGAVERDGQAYVVVLLSRRPLALGAFPREVARNAAAVLEGELLGLDAPTVHVTTPAGDSRQVEAAVDRRRFRARIRFDTPGRWLVEVVGQGPRGPEVAALLTVACGGASLAGPEASEDDRDPSDPSAAEARVLDAIDDARRRRGLPELERSRDLAAVARRHSEAMLLARTLAHVLPGSGDVGERLRQAKVAYRVVRENVAKGRSALAAHRAAEDSPAHRENILSRDVGLVGCGIARGLLPGGEPIVFLTEVFIAAPEDLAADRMLPDARVREALWREREKLKAPPLVSDPALDELARTAARSMLRTRTPPGEELGETALGMGRKLAAVDSFIATAPGDAARSRNLGDTRFRRVGVGVAVGDDSRYGVERLWIAVIYTD